MDPQALYVQLGRLIETSPNFFEEPIPYSQEVHRWLARAYALTKAAGNVTDAATLISLNTPLHSGHIPTRHAAITNVIGIVHRALATAELEAPLAAQGAFIPAGNVHDALVAFEQVLREIARDVLIVDPYMDQKALTDFVTLVPEGKAIRLLADQQHHKPTLQPAVHRWCAQYGERRPLVAKLAPPRTLHDRLLIVDGASVWVLTQSMNAFATKAPASIVRTDAETAALKVAAYEDMWRAATPL
jgi:hypothetical protein